MRSGILTLTTDFGSDGPYVAQMKGIILGIAPATQIVDVSHAIPPQDIAQGAFMLAQVVDAFPTGTVHLAVVDPGVGTDRALIVVEAGEHYFVLPDNGLIAWALRGPEPSKTWKIDNPKLCRPIVSSTFHGRDILAPVAAHLARGGDPARVGSRIDGPHLPRSIAPEWVEGRLAGKVIFVDSFGNLITNIDRNTLVDPEAWEVEILGRTIDGLVATYGQRSPSSLVALVGSSGLVEVAVVNGDASRILGGARGTPVVLRRRRGAGN